MNRVINCTLVTNDVCPDFPEAVEMLELAGVAYKVLDVTEAEDHEDIPSAFLQEDDVTLLVERPGITSVYKTIDGVKSYLSEIA